MFLYFLFNYFKYLIILNIYVWNTLVYTLTYTLTCILTYTLTYTLTYILIFTLTYIYVNNNYYEKVNLNFLKCYIFWKKSFSMVIKIYF